MVQKQKPLISNSSLYIHIPFCLKKCDYCDFYSVPCDALIPDSYIDAVIAESKYYRNKYMIAGWNTLYVGGGTPSLLKPEQLIRLIEGCTATNPSSCQNDGIEITVEMNPDDITDDLIQACASCGVTRLSVGVQAFDDDALSSVHRRCSKKTTVAGLDLLASKWKGRLSCDLIAGLPAHSEKSFCKGIDTLLSYPVEHVSLYTLTIEDETPLGKKINAGTVSWNPDNADSLWLTGRDMLESRGFMQYEVSNFAKPGCESRHNTVYWSLENYIGCGSGATGSWYGKPLEDGGCSTGIRWNNTKDISSYISFWTNKKITEEMIPRTVEVLDSETQEFEYLMMGFRMRRGISAKMFERRFNKSLETRIGAEFEAWEKKGMAEVRNQSSDTVYALNREGLLFLNDFLEQVMR